MTQLVAVAQLLAQHQHLDIADQIKNKKQSRTDKTLRRLCFVVGCTICRNDADYFMSSLSSR
jgi:hypothetical protein